MLLFDDPVFDTHDPGFGHPECPARLVAVRAALADLGLPTRGARLAERAELLAVHDAAHVDRVLACDGRAVSLDPDTHTSPGSVRAARAAAGAALDAADLLLDGVSSFVLARPPGHHATRRRAMGFCLFNHAALAADRLARAGRRVLLFDPDVHHGNGSQDIFWERGDVLYVSLHRAPFYPGTGSVDERGAGPGLGATVNVPLPAGAGDDAWRAAFETVALPAIDAFDPDAVVISAGFDGLAGDPLGGTRLSVDAMCALWRPLVRRAPTMAVLEGGYGLSTLAAGVRATAQLLAGRYSEKP
ncbi:MAG: histone deacetylase [Alphaproteobacteria bacterium]|nr:histone deacetylase [Alphaproteobacteria bacterium]